MIREIFAKVTVTAIITSTLALVACSNDQPVGDNDQPVSDQASCARQGDNLVQDPGFATLFANRSERRWHASEHAAGGTFKHEAEDGVLRIRKIGKEPWFLVSQSIDTKALARKTIAFSAEVKLNLREPEHKHGFGYGGGLSVLAKRGGKLVVNSTLEHEPNFGKHDWTPVEVVFKLPANTSYLRVGFIHQAGGNIEIRNPELYIVKSGCPVTVADKSRPG